MNTSLPILTHLEHRIRVAKILLDISQRTYGAVDANIKQHLAELMNSRQACSPQGPIPMMEKANGSAPVEKTYNLNRHVVHGDSQLTRT